MASSQSQMRTSAEGYFSSSTFSLDLILRWFKSFCSCYPPNMLDTKEFSIWQTPAWIISSCGCSKFNREMSLWCVTKEQPKCVAQSTQCLEKLVRRLASPEGTTPPLIHQLECQYLVEKLTTAVVIVKLYVRVLMLKYLAVVWIQNSHRVINMRLRAARGVDKLVSDCCKPRGILATVLLAKSLYFTELELEMCTKLMRNSWHLIVATRTSANLRHATCSNRET